ncbi:exosortase V [Sphingomonas sediminicola]|uniref:exosortase V n=2 Tax=Sphingomonas TaxID=13687 RepID=UPI0023DD45C0|nr:exosortase V ['Sphingomonas ginsengisoli' Hoang et al. 2012]
MLILGMLAMVLPPMILVAQNNWSTEQGGHGPIVLATGLWLLAREYRSSRGLEERGNLLLGLVALALFLAAFIVLGITGILELQVVAMYGALIAGAYLLVGARMLRAVWFPIFYMAFALPPPDTVVATLTNPVKIAISQGAVSLLHAFGYPVGSSGVVIQIAQYELFVAAACSGLNSLITLSAIGLFYVYLRHRSDTRALILMSLLVVPVAILANFIRVLILILLTYYVSEAAAQGFLHDFAGIVTFAAALGTMMALEALYSRVTARKPEVVLHG